MAVLAASLAARGWYRIAQVGTQETSTSGAIRSGAVFTLRDNTSSGGHSHLKMIVGMSYGKIGTASLNVLSHSYYHTLTFSEARLIYNDIYDDIYLEIKVIRPGSVSYVIENNAHNTDWMPENWTAGSIPTGFSSKTYSVGCNFSVCSDTQDFTVTNGGNVGIGTDNPGSKLDVRGDIITNRAAIGNSGHAGWASFSHKDKYTSTTDYGLIHHSDGTTILNCKRDKVLYLRQGNDGNDDITLAASGGVMSIKRAVNVTGAITATGDITGFYSSDKRLKDNLEKISEPIEKIKKINGYTFDWIPKEDVHINEGHDVGVVAQEVEEVLPEVCTTRDNGYKAVKYEKLTPLLIECIKKQQEQLDKQQEQIENLQEQINMLSNK
mgnify:CR=1 FL=1